MCVCIYSNLDGPNATRLMPIYCRPFPRRLMVELSSADRGEGILQMANCRLGSL